MLEMNILYRMLLSESEKLDLQKIVVDLVSKPEGRTTAKAAIMRIAPDRTWGFEGRFREYYARMNLGTKYSGVLKRFTRKKPAKAATIDASLALALYGFITTEFLSSISELTDDQSKEIADDVRSLMNKRSLRLLSDGVDNAFMHETPDGVKEQRGIEGAYFGYRHSSTARRIIRFSLRIWREDGENQLKFKNVYNTQGKCWETKGRGYISNNVTYLHGSAFNQKNSQEKRGQRFFALTRNEKNACLQGVVISQDHFGPIAAKVLIVRCTDHEFEKTTGPEPSDVINRNIDQVIDNYKIIGRKLKNAIDNIIENEKISQEKHNEIDSFLSGILGNDTQFQRMTTNSVPDYNLAEDFTIAAFREQVDEALMKGWNGTDVYPTLDEQISNISISTLKGYDLDLLKHDQRQKIDGLILKFEELKLRFYRSGAEGNIYKQDRNSIFEKLLEKHMEKSTKNIP